MSSETSRYLVKNCPSLNIIRIQQCPPRGFESTQYYFSADRNNQLMQTQSEEHDSLIQVLVYSSSVEIVGSHATGLYSSVSSSATSSGVNANP